MCMYLSEFFWLDSSSKEGRSRGMVGKGSHLHRMQTVVRTTEGDSKAFKVKVRLHQGSVLSPLLFVIVM